MPALNKYMFHFAAPTAGPVKLRFRYAGPINTENDSGNKPFRPEGYELFLDHMWYPVGADIQTRFTVDATIDGLAPDLVVVATHPAVNEGQPLVQHRLENEVLRNVGILNVEVFRDPHCVQESGFGLPQLVQLFLLVALVAMIIRPTQQRFTQCVSIVWYFGMLFN